MKAVLEVKNLKMYYDTQAGQVKAADNISFSLYEGESMGLVGESGCGKTSVSMSIMRLLPENARIISGNIFFGGKDIVKISNEDMNKVRWAGISMIFQAAMNSLNPVYRVGDQIIEAITTHEPNVTFEEARQRVASLYKLVGLDPERMDNYPHEYSGGMKQRAVIAMSLACNPKLIIADEPTTALDVIVQDTILRELEKIQKKLNMSMIYISHDIAVIAEVASKIAIMYAGKIVEMSDSITIFKRPAHPYTVGLMSSFPSIRGPKKELVTIPGEPPNLLNAPDHCRFAPRCPFATDECWKKEPSYEEIENNHFVACFHPQNLKKQVRNNVG
ncbi:ABC transporter ATP-binding protein [Athalassotoga saccharophila]|uniref:ABC transporter ATP-binding protein n=1 Tax=Athalassotoga saccharophila TaxID=1441386 RepID=UPI001379A3A7|nr:ABC transporter ATP-binding protein [Athalassotoga saccharophila]BBJ28042.1 oligopeptide transport ATP-binding protein OppD [Athalassotoga saccharophila]